MMTTATRMTPAIPIAGVGMGVISGSFQRPIMKRVVWGARPSGISAPIPERVGRAPHRIVLNEAAISDVILGDSIGDGEGASSAVRDDAGTDRSEAVRCRNAEARWGWV
jgi:hypothetical protein